MLKVNIEGQELDVLKSLTPDILERIGVICAEITDFPGELEVQNKRPHRQKSEHCLDFNIFMALPV